MTADGYALDFGVQRDSALLPGLTLGAALQNLGPAVRFQRADEKLPLNLRTGASYRFGAFGQPSVAAFDVTKERSESPLIGPGVEVSAMGALLKALEAGPTERQRAEAESRIKALGR